MASLTQNSDFSPWSPIFEKRHFNQIIASDVGIGLVLFGLWSWAQMSSWTTVIAYYGIPYLVVNNYLVLITYLQQRVPHLQV